jgi:hypothetical protein
MPDNQPCEMRGSQDATFGPDPFLADVYNDDTPHWLCEEMPTRAGDGHLKGW